jgi:hypothetical protein
MLCMTFGWNDYQKLGYVIFRVEILNFNYCFDVFTVAFNELSSINYVPFSINTVFICSFLKICLEELRTTIKYPSHVFWPSGQEPEYEAEVLSIWPRSSIHIQTKELTYLEITGRLMDLQFVESKDESLNNSSHSYENTEPQMKINKLEKLRWTL